MSDIYLGYICEESRAHLQALAKRLTDIRSCLIIGDDGNISSLRKKFKLAEKHSAKLIILAGEEEVKNNLAILMYLPESDKKQYLMSCDEAIDYIINNTKLIEHN